VLDSTIPSLSQDRKQLVIGNYQLSADTTLETFGKKANFLEQPTGAAYLSTE